MRIKYKYQENEQTDAIVRYPYYNKISVSDYIHKAKESKRLHIVLFKEKKIAEIGNEIMNNVDELEVLAIHWNRFKKHIKWIDWNRVKDFKDTLIDFSASAFTSEEDISFLKTAPKIEYLALNGTMDSTIIKNLDKLKNLTLLNTTINHSNFINKLDLQYIDFLDIKINRDVTFPSLPKLCYVSLVGIKERDIDFISTCENLQILYIHGGDLEVFPDLSKCTKLEQIYVLKTTKLKNIDGLLKCPNLKSLHFVPDSPHIKNENMTAIANMSTLNRRWIFLHSGHQTKLFWQDYPNSNFFDVGEIMFEII